MGEISRRKMLLSGGALGAASALTVAAPAAARPLWTWRPSGSVAGQGTGADPHYVWDPLTDPVVSSLLDRGDVPMVNQVLRSWRKNSDPLPDGLPSDVRDYMEQARQLPSWTDHDKLEAAKAFYETRGLYIDLCYGFASGMMSTVIPHEALAVYYSLGGADMRGRITRTAKLGKDIGAVDAYDPDGEMIVTAVRTRMKHASIRHLLPQSPQFRDAEGDGYVPISQADIMVTWHSLATTVMNQLDRWPLDLSDDEAEAYLHLWQVSVSMLGVDDEYIPNSWDEANAQREQVLDPALASTPEGVELADILLGLASFDLTGDNYGPLRPVLHALTRYMLGDDVANAMEIPRERFWDPVVEWAWPRFVAAREGALTLPIPSQAYWAFDEILRHGVLIYLSEGDLPIFIEMATENRSF